MMSSLSENPRSQPDRNAAKQNAVTQNAVTQNAVTQNAATAADVTPAEGAVSAARRAADMTDRPLAIFRVRVAQTLLASSVVVLAVLSVPGILASDTPMVKVATVVPLVLAGVLLTLLAWRFPNLTMIRMTFLSLAALVTLVNVFWGGETLSGLGGFTVLILMAGFLLGKRAALLTAVYSAVVAAATISGVFSVLPEPLERIQGQFVDTAPVLRIVLETLYYMVAALIMWVFVTWIDHSWASTRQREQQLNQMLSDLNQTNLSRNYYDKILRSMSNVVIVADPEGQIRTVNPAALRLLGYVQDEIIGRRLSTVFDFDASQFTFAHRRGEDTFAGEAYMIAKDGIQIPVTYTRSILRGENRAREGMIVVAQDIRERVAAEQERTRQANRFRALFEQTNDAIFLFELEGRHIAVNRRAADLVGYSVEELLRMDFRELVASNERESSEEIMQLLLKGQQLPPYERTFIHRRGQEVPVEVSISIVQDAEGAPLHMQSVVRDIRERKAIEQRLRYQASLLENVSDAIISTDLNGQIVSWNRASETVYGWFAEEVVGKLLKDIVPTEYDGITAAEVRQHVMAHGYWRGEIIQRSRDGRELIMLTSITVMRDSLGNSLGVVIISHDITRRKIAEREQEIHTQQLAILRQLDVEVNSTLDVQHVLYIGLQAVRIISNAEAGFIALTKADEMIVSMTFGAYDSRIPINTPLQNMGATGRAIQLREAQFIPDVGIDPDYVTDILETRSQMIFPLMSQVRVTGVLTLETSEPEAFNQELFDFLRIVTARISIALENAELYQDKQQQLEELTTLYERVKNLEALKTDMIRMASHDLRGPLGVVKGYTEILLEDLTGRIQPEEQEYFESMRNSLTRMQSIVNDILSNQRIEEMAERSNLEIVDMAMLTQTLVSHHEHLIARKKQKLITDIGEAQMLVQIDIAQLREAMANLIENAIKYTPDHGTVRVSVERCNDKVVFKVEDNGPGIPKEQQTRLFEAFYRAQNDHNKDIEGTGLGLSLVKGIIERSGGKIIFESVEHKGSTFGFELPLFPGT